MPDKPTIEIAGVFVNHDARNMRVDIMGDTTGYILVVNGAGYHFSLLEQLRSLDRNALYKITNTGHGLNLEEVHVSDKKKETWN